MRKAVRAIIVKDDKLLVMKRDKFGKQYYTLVGGHIEPGETAEHALLREIHEETGIAANVVRQVYVEHANIPYGDQLVFLCEYVSGEPQLQPTSDEALITQMGQNLYLPMWLPLSDLSKVPFRSAELGARLQQHLVNGKPFAEHVEEFKSVIT